MQFAEIKERILPLVEKPNRYTGNEMNVIRKSHEAVKLTFALCFPDSYEIGMSHLGFKILYHILNKRDDVVAERAFCPWIDMEALLRQHRIPLFSQETHTALKNFDILGFTLQYELSYTNILNMLDLAHVPVLSSERSDDDPLVIAGGPCATNPEPLALFLDAVLIGEAEDAIHEIVDCVATAKEKKLSRQETLFELAQIEGIYVPCFYQQKDDGRVVATIDGVPERIKRRFLSELRPEDAPTEPVVPITTIIHERIMIEVMRGCTVGCRFCHAGMYYRPVRERSVEDVLDLARKTLKSTGYDNISLLSLSSADYTCVGDVISRANEEFEKDRISLSLPSLRPDVFTIDLADGISSVKKSGLTFALEAGTQRLRDVLNKPNSEEALYSVVKNAFQRSWKTIKLYFMIGLPTETSEDLDGIAHILDTVYSLGRKHGKGKITINATISPFVPKPHTPFQWEALDTIEAFYRKVRYVESKLTSRKINIKYHAPRGSYLECILTRGDRKVSKVIYRAWQKGCRFDSWGEHFRFDRWMDAFAEMKLEPDLYAQELHYNSNLAWDHIDIHIGKEFLWQEHEKAYANVTTSDCRWGKCNVCGIPRGKICNVLAGEHPIMNSGDSSQIQYGRRKERITQKINSGDAKSKVRIAFRRDEKARFISHLDLIELINKALHRAEIPVVYSQGFSPRPRLSFGPALPVGMCSEAEYIDLQLEKPVPDLQKKLNAAISEGIKITAIKPIFSKTSSLSATIDLASYEVEGVDLPCDDVVASLLTQKEIQVQRTTKKGDKRINIRPYIYSIQLDAKTKKIKLLLQVGNEGHARPDEVLKLLTNISDEDILLLKIVRTGLYIRQDDDILTPMDVI